MKLPQLQLLAEAKSEPMIFDSEDDAERFINWATKNGYDDYSMNDIKDDGMGGYTIRILPVYAHDAKTLHSKAIAL